MSGRGVRKHSDALALGDWAGRRRRAIVTGLAMASVAGLLATAGVRPAAAAADGVALGYEGYLGGFHMMSADVELSRTEKRYRMVTNAEGRGLIGWFFDWSSKAVTEGAIAADGSLRPQHHWRDMIRGNRPAKIIQIEYRDDGVPLVARMRKGGQAKFAPAANRKGTIDPMSVVTAIFDQMTAGQACKGQFEVFDGKLRYDAVAAMGKPGRLKRSSYMMYGGMAERCDLTLTAIDGFDDDKPKGNPRTSNSPGNDSIVLSLYFASPAAGMPSVPVMASADSSYGGLRIYLTKAESADIPVEGQRADAR